MADQNRPDQTHQRNQDPDTRQDRESNRGSKPTSDRGSSVLPDHPPMDDEERDDEEDDEEIEAQPAGKTPKGKPLV